MPHQLTPEIVAGAATIMATAWWYPPVAITEEALLNADKEAPSSTNGSDLRIWCRRRMTRRRSSRLWITQTGCSNI